jgi:hypothetical protein
MSLAGCLFRPDEIGVDWGASSGVRDWLARRQAAPYRVRPFAPMPGHPPSAAN